MATQTTNTINKSVVSKPKEIKYLSKNFADFRDNLINFSKVYFPDSYSDFNETSPGMIFIEMASYVGDVLSYYIDSQFKESLLEFTEERENIISMAQALGYKPKTGTSSITTCTVYQIVPAKGQADNFDPDERFYLTIDVGLIAVSQEFANVTFRTIDIINFLDPTNRTIDVYSLDPVTNRPLTYRVGKDVKVVSGQVKTFTYSFGSAAKFSTITLPDPNVLEIISIIDSNGYTWLEVDYLAQDIVYEEMPNTNFSVSVDPTANPSPLLSIALRRTPRRFITRYDRNFLLQIQFGSGVLSDDSELISINSTMVASDEYDNGLASTSIDPVNFLSSTSYGLAPSNTQMTITYSVGGGIESNVPANTIDKIKTINVINNTTSLSGTELNLFQNIIQTVSITNAEPATGGKGVETIDETRQNAMAFFNAQNRLVTREDYMVRSLAMPAKYGGVAKVYAVQDEQVNDIIRNTNNLAPVNGIYVDNRVSPNFINLYTLGYDSNMRLTTLNYDTKVNLATYLDSYRMLTDRINILDAFVVNIGVNFQIAVAKNKNINDVLVNSIGAITTYFDITTWQINQPIILSDLQSQLILVDGVQSVISLEIVNKYQYKDGSDYNPYIYDISSATNNGVIFPSIDPVIFELRYPENDVVGSALQ